MDLDRKIQPSAGLFVSFLIIAVPMFGWKFWYPFTELSTIDAFIVSIAKIGAFGGLAMFAMSLVLSGRYTFFEKAFGGLDKVYIAHRMYGTAGLALLVLHPIALTLLTNNPGVVSSVEFLLGVNDLSILLGAVSLYGFVGLIIWSITTKASYETFLKVHKITGLLFIAGAIHAFATGSILEQSRFMAGYLGVLSVAGASTYVLYTLLGDALHRPYRYTVTSVKESNGVVELIMEPRSMFIKFTPGQFVYVSIPDIDLTYHPFSIASGKFDGKLRFAIRMSGDYTRKLTSIHSDAKAYIKGPYGGFTFLQHKNKKQLWIAGGIGVTPFLSGARSMRRSHEKGMVEMIYASDDTNPYGLKELETIEDQNPAFNVTHFHKEKFGHVSLEVLQEQLKDLHERVIYICGPPVMMNVLKDEAERLGLSENIHTEEFAY